MFQKLLGENLVLSIAPVHLNFDEAMERTNHAILYGEVTHYTVDYEDERKLEAIVEQASSSASKMIRNFYT